MAASGLFVTGTSRSGTSLLDKLLSMHPEIDVLSQPLPRLYVEAKRRFLERAQPAAPAPSDLAQAFPLGDMFGDMFGENRSEPGAFATHLRSTRFGPDWLLATLQAMQGFSGLGVHPKFPPEALIPPAPTSLAAFVAHYLAAVSERPDVAMRGSKEVFAEEFIPYFLQAGTRVTLLVRDPRDVVASVFGDQGARYAGTGLPVLFVLRQWRKSVAFALAHVGDPGLRLLRYEDLVTRPAEQMAALADWLGQPPFSDQLMGQLCGPLRDRTGAPWLSNSSHDPVYGISSKSIGRGTLALPKSLIRAIETLCGPEMRALGYAAPRQNDPAGILAAVTEPCRDPRALLAPYVWGETALRPELQRLAGIESGQFSARLHLFQTAFDHLVQPDPIRALWP